MAQIQDRVLLILEIRIILEKVHSISHRSQRKIVVGLQTRRVLYPAGFPQEGNWKERCGKT